MLILAAIVFAGFAVVLGLLRRTDAMFVCIVVAFAFLLISILAGSR